jgi:hypothetical protein
MKSQKEAVIEEVLLHLPSFNQNQDIALTMLTHDQLESIKGNVFNAIISGVVEYGKDPNNHAEARTYARSMTMNWLKKAKELNGGYVYRPAASSTNTAGSVKRATATKLTVPVAPKGVKVELLTPFLQEYVKSLV